MVVAFCGWVGSSKARRLTPRRTAATSASRMTRSLSTNISRSIEWRVVATAASAAARIPSPGRVTSTSTCRSGAGGGMGVGSPASARSCRNTRSRLSTTGPAARTSTSWFSAEWLPQLMPPRMARTPWTIRSFPWSIVRRSSGNATPRTPPCSSTAQLVSLLRSEGSLIAVTVNPRSWASSSIATRSSRWNSYSSSSIERRAARKRSTIAANALGPSGSGTSWSAPLMIGAETAGRGIGAIAGEGVRPGAQEATSSARRRRGNRRRRAGPYTDRYYYGVVDLSMLDVGPAHRGVGGIIQRPCDEDISWCRGTRARPPRHAGRPSSDPQGERAGWHHRRRRRFRRRLSHQTGPGKEPLLRHDRTGGPVRRGLGRLYPGKPRSLIRRGLLAVGAGVPLLALVTVLALVFRNVVLGPEMPRPGGTFVEGVVGQLGSLNPLYGEATAGSNDLDALLFEPLVRVLPTGGVEGRLAAHWDVTPDGRSYSFTLRPNARWSDGTTVTADDIVFTVRTVQDPQFPGAVLNQSWKDIIATAIDAGHVRFALPGHNAGFLANLELLDIVPSHLLAGRSMAEIASAAPNLNPVGTGPFRMVAQSGDRIQLERNPFAWRRPWLDTMTIRSFGSQAAALDALDRGQIDGLANLTPSGAAQERGNRQVSVLAASTYQYAELLMNLKTDEPFFQDIRVRQAIGKAIDRAAIIRNVLGGQAVPDDGPIPRSIAWAYDSANQQPAHDTAAAAQLLDDAGS